MKNRKLKFLFLLVFLIGIAPLSQAQTPFPFDCSRYKAQDDIIMRYDHSQLSLVGDINTTADHFYWATNANGPVHIAISPWDQLMYAIQERNDNHLYRIDANGTLVSTSLSTGLPQDLDLDGDGINEYVPLYIALEADDNGFLYTADNREDNTNANATKPLYQLNLAAFGTAMTPTTVAQVRQWVADLVFLPGTNQLVSYNGQTNELMILDVATFNPPVYITVGGMGGFAGNYSGALWRLGNDGLIVFSNTSRDIWEIRIDNSGTTPVATGVDLGDNPSNEFPTGNTDGAQIPWVMPAPTVSFVPTSNDPCNPGEGGAGTLLADVIGNGPFDFIWSNGGTGSSIFYDFAGGTYSVTVSDACGVTAEASLTLPATPTLPDYRDRFRQPCLDAPGGIQIDDDNNWRTPLDPNLYLIEWFNHGNPAGPGNVSRNTNISHGDSWTVCVTMLTAPFCKTTFGPYNVVDECDPCLNLTAQFSANLVSLPGGWQFQDGSTAGTGTVDFVLWDFGDGTTRFALAGSIVNHQYTSNQTFEVCLTAYTTGADGECCTAQSCQEVEVIGVNENPGCEDLIAGFTAQDLGNGNILFTNTSSHPTDLVIWDFDGTVQLLPGQPNVPVLHQFPGSGTYTVTITIVDVEGQCCRDEFSLEIAVDAGSSESAQKTSSDLGSGSASNYVLSQELTDLKAYPNPFGHQFTVDFQSEEAGLLTLTLRNTTGQVIHTSTEDYQGQNQPLTVQFETDQLDQGLYLLEYSFNGQRGMRKVVKSE